MSQTDFYQQKARLLLKLLPKSGQRIRRGVFQEIAAGTDGVVSESYLRQMVRGHIVRPGADKLLALAKQLEFPADWWSLPVEAGPPPAVPEIQQLTVALMTLPPEKQAAVAERLLTALAKLSSAVVA